MVGLSEKAHAYPAQLSGGQQQRIAIARALATNPKVLLCDEATSALDPNTTHSILELIREDINKRMGITVIVITHQMSVVEEICNRVAILDNGRIVEEGDVASIFSHPRSDAAKRLMFPDTIGETQANFDGRLIRVSFNGTQAAGTPLITQMAIDINIAANICHAATRCIGKKVYGTMLLGLPDDDETVARAIAYLVRNEIIVEEAERNA